MKFFCSFVPVRKYRLKDEKKDAEGIWEEQHLLEVAKEINCAAGKFSQLFYNDLHMIFFLIWTFDASTLILNNKGQQQL